MRPLCRATLCCCAALVAWFAIGMLASSASAQQNHPAADQDVELFVLGTAQDGGYPQAGCRRSCCAGAWSNDNARRFPTSLVIVDHVSRQRWFLECTPAFAEQLRLSDQLCGQDPPGIDGVLLTHAHIGHYAGLIHLGREVMGTSGVPVHAMPRMASFLRSQGPWSQLVELENIRLQPLEADRPVRLSERLQVTPIRVPHRDEFSETVAFRIQGPNRTVLFLPDIDKWDRWERSIADALADVDVAYVDGTFFADGELPGRDMSKIPHPFIVETIARLRDLPAEQRSKVRFIHLNHTNPALDPSSDARRQIEQAGMHVAEQGERVGI